MRKELELMEAIEKYINGTLSETDKIAFEKKLQSSPELQKELELQKKLMKGIERAGLKQSAKQASKKYKFNKNLKNWGLTGLTIAIITASAFVMYNSVTKNSGGQNTPNVLPELNEQGTKTWSDADKYLPLQSFELNPEKDTVVETKDGIVIAIPANSFLDANGKPAKGPVMLEVKEALNAADIMKAGLTTKSGDQLLETGGMFYINARKDGASLKIDPKNPLYAEIPTDEAKPGMQLFEGKRLPDGNIDWINPKPIEKDLLPVDILSLNFYPPDYLPSLNNWGYNIKNKKFTDSLYYSFAVLFNHEMDSAFSEDRMDRLFENAVASLSDQPGITVNLRGQSLFEKNCAVCHSLGSQKITGPGLQGVFTRVPSKEWMHTYIKDNDALIRSGDPYAVKMSKYDASAMPVFNYMSDEDIDAIINYVEKMDPFANIRFGDVHGINPAKIKAIWNEKFQNTLLSTREFEERLPYIHKTCDEDVLNMYVNNLDRNLSSIDSLVAKMDGRDAEGGKSAYRSGYEEFLKFAARGDGKVKNGNKNFNMLKSYYEKRSKMYTEQITKAVSKFWEGQSEKDKEAFLKRNQQDEAESKRLVNNFTEELNLNVDEAYRQLGYKKLNRPPAAVYGTTISSVGWNNIDKLVIAVIESTTNRTTLDYTDSSSGKKAVIRYEPLSVSVNDLTNYDRILVYLLPDKLNSFMRIDKKENVFEEKLNELMTYKLVCIGYKGEESFYYSQDNVKPGKVTVSLVKTTNAQIQDNVNRFSQNSQVKAMNDELNYIAFEKDEDKRQQQLTNIRELTQKVQPVIFPCMVSKADSIDGTRDVGPANK